MSKRKDKNFCDACEEPHSRINQAHGIRLCKKCLGTDEYRLICKSRAKEKFYLTDKELKDVDSLSAPNSYGRYDLVLYNRREIIEIFCRKYGINADNEHEINSKRNEIYLQKQEIRDIAREKRQIAIEEKRKIRKKELKKKLSKKGLDLRPDSKLCEEYINGKIKDVPIEVIVDRMCQMKYLYDYCNMDHYLKKIKKLRNRTNYKKYEYESYISVFDEAELMALEKYGKKGDYPKRWPWLNV